MPGSTGRAFHILFIEPSEVSKHNQVWISFAALLGSISPLCAIPCTGLLSSK